MSRITPYDDVPQLVRSELERFLAPLDEYVPGWCAHVWVKWSANDSGNDSTVADILTSYDYRWARLTVYASWLDQTEEFKREALIHELMHLFTAPLADYAKAMLKLLISEEDDEKFSKATHREFDERCEAVTQDLTNFMLNGKSARGVAPVHKEPYARSG